MIRVSGCPPASKTPALPAGAWASLPHLNKPPGFVSEFPGSVGTQIAFANTDMAFQGDYAFVGNFNGFNIYNIANPRRRRSRPSVVCPGGQGDLSVYGNLLFMSVEETTRARSTARPTPAADATTRFRGVRIFDI